MGTTEDKVSTKDILKVIAIGSLVIASVAVPNLPIALGYLVKQWKNYNRKDLGKVIKRLEKQRMICINERDDKTVIEITEKGKRRILEYEFENISIKKKKLDGKWRLIIFDIPEDKRSSRDAFRKKLLQLDMIRLQDSVFASAYPCKQEIDFLCHYLGLSDFVTLVKLDQIERGERLIFKRDYEAEWGQ